MSPSTRIKRNGLPAALRRTGIILGALLGLVCPTPAAELTDAASTLFSGSANCAFCHDQWGRGLTGHQGGMSNQSIAFIGRGRVALPALPETMNP